MFWGTSGAALADIGALGGTQIKLMREQGYRDEFAAGITVAAATIGPIFPPSIPLIIFAAAAEVSAFKVLLAGAIRALVIAAMLMLQIGIMARRQNPAPDVRRDDDPTLAQAFVPGLSTWLPNLIVK